MTDPYWHTDGITLHAGDCLNILATMPDNTIDAIVTDPPYNLSASGKRDDDCLRRILAEVRLPQLADLDPERGQRSQLPRPPLGGPSLGRVDRPVGVSPRIGVPKRAVDFKDSAVGEQEVHNGDEPAMRTPDANLATVTDAEAAQFLGHFVLQSTDGRDAAFCDATCSCFTEPSDGVIAVRVALPCAPGSDPARDLFSALRPGDKPVRTSNDAGGVAQGAASVVAGAGTVLRAVLRIDLRGRTGELLPAGSADHGDTPFLLLPAQSIGASAGTSGLAAESEPARIRLVADSADRALSLHLPWHKIKSSRMTGGFMGKKWDGWDSPASFQRWCTAWATEAHRVMKPGAHLLAFGGTRTFHRLACAIEDAGFEIRDSIAWLHSQGFAKSLDVSKAIDRRPGVERHSEFAADLRAAMAAKGYTNTFDVAEVVVGRRTGAVANWQKYQWPEAKWWPALRDLLDMDEAKWGPVIAEAERVRTGRHLSGLATGSAGVGGFGEGKDRHDAPATPAAQQWAGWGSAMKPAHESIVCARKPLVGTLAQNVLTYGTGALNIDGCRVGLPEDKRAAGSRRYISHGMEPGAVGGEVQPAPHDGKGRWPANVVLDGGYPGSAADTLDEQTGISRSSVRKPSGKDERGIPNTASSVVVRRNDTQPRGVADSGGASRFFKVVHASPADSRPDPFTAPFVPWRYEAKAPTSERPRVPGEPGAPVLRLREDLTDEERAYVLTELGRAGIDITGEDGCADA
jgi:hypothetical protein